jgi:hypothetical protein
VRQLKGENGADGVIIDVIEDALWIDPLAKANGDRGFEMTIAAAVPSGRPAATRLNRG